MAAHTPGPWHVSGTLGAAGDDLRMVKDSRTVIAYATRPVGDEPHERDANARLIAEAPAMRDLLARLADVDVDADPNTTIDGWRNFARKTAKDARTLLARIDGEK